MDGGGTNESVTAEVTSADGSVIGYEVVGQEGPPLLVVHGGAADRTQWAPIKEPLAESFTVYLMDRRGRSLSAAEAGNGYSLEREAEDIVAVAGAIGQPTSVFGHAFGGLATLKAALLGADFTRILIDESPSGLPGPPLMDPEVEAGMRGALEEGGRDGMLEFFLRHVVGLDDAAIEGVRGTPIWETRKGIVHTLLREARVAFGYEREVEALAAIDVPVRIVVGDESTEPMRVGAEAMHRDMPQSELVVLKGRLFTTMYTDPTAVVEQLREYFLR